MYLPFWVDMNDNHHAFISSNIKILQIPLTKNPQLLGDFYIIKKKLLSFDNSFNRFNNRLIV
jgi:hypothetical protein